MVKQRIAKSFAILVVLLPLAFAGVERAQARDTYAVVLLDTSGSMADSDPDNHRYNGLNTFIDLLGKDKREATNHVAVMEFWSRNKLARKLSPVTLESREIRPRRKGATILSPHLAEARGLLAEHPDAYRYVLLLTDGILEPSRGKKKDEWDRTVQEATMLGEAGVPIFSIVLNPRSVIPGSVTEERANERWAKVGKRQVEYRQGAKLLQELAELTKGQMYELRGDQTFVGIFEEISMKMATGFVEFRLDAAHEFVVPPTALMVAFRVPPGTTLLTPAGAPVLLKEDADTAFRDLNYSVRVSKPDYGDWLIVRIVVRDYDRLHERHLGGTWGLRFDNPQETGGGIVVRVDTYLGVGLVTGTESKKLHVPEGTELAFRLRPQLSRSVQELRDALFDRVALNHIRAEVDGRQVRVAETGSDDGSRMVAFQEPVQTGRQTIECNLVDKEGRKVSDTLQLEVEGLPSHVELFVRQDGKPLLSSRRRLLPLAFAVGVPMVDAAGRRTIGRWAADCIAEKLRVRTDRYRLSEVRPEAMEAFAALNREMGELAPAVYADEKRHADLLERLHGALRGEPFDSFLLGCLVSSGNSLTFYYEIVDPRCKMVIDQGRAEGDYGEFRNRLGDLADQAVRGSTEVVLQGHLPLTVKIRARQGYDLGAIQRPELRINGEPRVGPDKWERQGDRYEVTLGPGEFPQDGDCRILVRSAFVPKAGHAQQGVAWTHEERLDNARVRTKVSRLIVGEDPP